MNLIQNLNIADYDIHVDNKAYLAYLFNEFKDKEMGDPNNYLLCSKIY